MSSYFQGKTVLVTGAASGIGRSLTETLAAQGATVAALDLRAEALAELADTEGVHTWAADVSDPEVMERATDEITEKLGFVDLVIANAGLGGLNPAYDFSPDVSHRTMRVNIDGMVNTVAPFMRRMVEARKGHIVGISSLASFRGLPNAGSYSASKAAQRVMLESWRVDLKPHGVTVSCICPGFVQTAMTAHDEFPMPFTVPVERSTRLILRAIEKKRALYLYPWQMRWLTLLNRLLPPALFDWLIPRLSRGPGEKQKAPKVF